MPRLDLGVQRVGALTDSFHVLANGEVIRRLLDANAVLQRPTPLLVTPEEILSTPDEDES